MRTSNQRKTHQQQHQIPNFHGVYNEQDKHPNYLGKTAMIDTPNSEKYTYEAALTDDVLDEDDAENKISQLKAIRKPPADSQSEGGRCGIVNGFIDRYPVLTICMSVIVIILVLYHMSGLEIEIVKNDTGVTKPNYHPDAYTRPNNDNGNRVRRRAFVIDNNTLQ